MFVIQVIPMQVLAQAAESSQEIIEDTPSPLLYEVVEKRDGCTKVFMREDGTYSAITYPEPIHFFEDGVWKEVDNTFVEKTDENGNAFLTNKENNVDVVMPSSFTDDTPISVTSDGSTISFKMNDIDNTKSIDTVLPDQKETSEQSELQKAADVKTLNSEITYEEVKEDTDVQYIISKNAVKENIILSNKPARKDAVYSFTVGAEGLTAKKNTDNSITFKDKNGKVKFEIPAPFMFDKNNVIFKDIVVDFQENGNNQYTLIYTPSYDFLSDSKTDYPVTIDPIIRTSSEDQIFDTYLSNTDGCVLTTNQSLDIALAGNNEAAIFDFGADINSRERERKGLMKKRCEYININESDVDDIKQAGTFDYFNGINKIYRKTKNDPYYNTSLRIRIPFKVRSGWMGEHII